MKQIPTIPVPIFFLHNFSYYTRLNKADGPPAPTHLGTVNALLPPPTHRVRNDFLENHAYSLLGN